MIEELQALLHVTLPSAKGPRSVELTLPPVLRISALLDDGDIPLTAERLARVLPSLVFKLVRRIDGSRIQLSDADALCEDATFVRALLSHAKALIDTYRERGAVFVLCPGCKTWETEVSFTAYALAIDCAIPSAFDGPWLRPLTLASRTLLGEPRGRKYPQDCARIRFKLPSTTLEMTAPFKTAVLGRVKHQPEDYQQQRDDDDDDDDDDFDEDDEDPPYKPVRQGAGWRALHRLSRAIEPPVTVEQLEELSCLDLFFLELVHFLVWKSPVRDDTPGVIHCPTCSTAFVPFMSR